MESKIIAVLIFLVLAYTSTWIFNHINPWLGWLAFISVGWLGFKHFFKQYKQQKS